MLRKQAPGFEGPVWVTFVGYSDSHRRAWTVLCGAALTVTLLTLQPSIQGGECEAPFPLAALLVHVPSDPVV